MRIRLVSHASVIVECTDAVIWTDPWLTSKAFNNSWTLLPEANFDRSLLERIGFIWLSHEHPDHLNLPTLASLPAEFKSRVQILFQQNNPERIFDALRKIGYCNFAALPHRGTVPVSSETAVYCLRVGTIDSCLGIVNQGRRVFNANDARMNNADCKTVLNDLGMVDVVLNQFSLAVHNGYADHATYLPRAARNVLESLSNNQRDLRAPVTIPFASLMYFSTVDNRFMNAYTNKPREVFDFCASRGQQVNVLYPGDEWEVGEQYDSAPALARYDRLYAGWEDLPYDTPPVISLATLREAFQQSVAKMRERYPDLLLRRLKPLRIEIPDLALTAIASLANGSLEEAHLPGAPDLIVRSQPLHYCFSYPWGMQTLTISARFTVGDNLRNWQNHKALFALYNADVYLKPMRLLRRRNRDFVIDKLNSLRRYSDRSLAPGA
jgi:UDP-MurNAc hydroxylase